MSKEILIIDDNIKICQTLSKNFHNFGYKTYCATNNKDAINSFSKHDVKVVILDIVLDGEDGLDVLQNLFSLNNKVPVIIITGYASIETAVKSIKIGAFDYLKKPLDFEKLLRVVENAMQTADLKRENVSLKRRLIDSSAKILTQNKYMVNLCKKAKLLATSDLPILITGENGTGKELIADFIHTNSPRISHEMIKINCAAFPEHLLDNEFFGHEKGAYTGAENIFKGVFERAQNSTLFLDEIGDMSTNIQSKILRTFQNYEIRRLGGSKTITVDVRFIASTNKNLKKLIEEKKFREDLFYRLNAATLEIIPLRDRKEDILFLIDHFLSEFSILNSKKINKISDFVLEKFLEYQWPGNIRELKNTINYSATITTKDFIDLDDLPTNFEKTDQIEKTINIREEMEKNLILRVLKQNNNIKTKTAERLHISRKTLYNKMEKYDISNK